jgi:hypothetical protein
MNKPTLIIGIGTSGLKVVEQVQHFYYENTGSNKPKNVEYLYLETDESAQPGLTVLPNEIKAVYISLDDRETMINSLKKDYGERAFWLPPAETILEAGFGAGGIPAFGRVALWGQDNFNNVADSIENAYSRIASHDVEESDDSKPAVFITGSLTGGTGAGVFIDVAYLVRDLIDDISEVYGLFLIPGKQSYRGNEILYCNTFAAFQSLEYYNKPENKYELEWPNGHKVSFSAPPYELAQFISQDYTGFSSSISKLSGLYKIAGLNLFLNIYGLRSKRLTRLGDAKSNVLIDKYGTFGLSAIQYPKSQLEEYLSINLSVELLKRWIDFEKYYSLQEKVQIKSNISKIYNEINSLFEQMLRRAIDSLDSVETGSDRQIISDLEVQAKIINEKKHGEKSGRLYVFNLFSADRLGNYYEAVKNNIRKMEGELIGDIYQLIAVSIDRYESLHLAKIQLEYIVRAIDNCINYWKSIKISSKAANWEQMLNEQINWVLSRRYKIIGEQNNVLRDRLKTVFDLMKMHISASVLVKLRNDIVASKHSLKTFGDNIQLPQIKQIDKLIDTINKIIGTDDNAFKNIKTLKTRKLEIEEDIRDNTIPILRIFPSGSFELEAENSLRRYIQNSGKTYPSKKTLIGEENLWEYLTKGDLSKKLYKNCITGFELDLRNYDSIEDMDVSDYNTKQPDDARKIAKRASYPLLKINKDNDTMFAYSKYIPKLIIAQSVDSVSKTLEVFRDANFNHFSGDDDGTLIKDDLRNIMVFYDEKGYMHDKSNFEPLRHLRYINELEDMYEEYPKDMRKSEYEWHILRSPYIEYGEKTK